jgi:hypothetical protein
MRIQNESLTLSGTDMTDNITSSPVWLAHIAYYSIQLVFTGTPNGTLKLQVSNDNGMIDSHDPSSASITNWTDLADSSQVISASGDHMWNERAAGYRWVRVVWTDNTSGSPSTLTVARFNVKGN